MRDLIAKAQSALGAALPDDFVAEFEALREVEFRAHLQPIPGARTAVQQVRAAGAKVCVASQGKLAKTELTLTLTGLRDLFSADDELFSAHSSPAASPTRTCSCTPPARWTSTRPAARSSKTPRSGSAPG